MRHALAATVAEHREDVPDVHRVVLPTPWMRSVNAYLLEGTPLTLVDTGPGLSASTAALRNALAALGYRLGDLELLVLTHQHFDHMGAALRLAEASGAEVAAFGPAAAFVADYRVRAEAEDDWVGTLMERHGVPPGTARAARMFARLETHLAESVEVTRPLNDGDVLEAGGRRYHVAHRPGHSPSDLVLHDEHDGLLLAGDHLLGRVTSNALLALPLVGRLPASGRPKPLVEYRRSLALTQAMDVGLVLPGHGDPFTGASALVGDRLRRQDGRAEKLLKLLGDGPQSAFALAESVWGGEASGQTFLVLSEMLGHLDLLLAAGAIEELEDEAVVRYAVAT